MAFPGTYDFSYYRGDTFNFTISPKDSTGASFVLSGYTATFTIATARGSGATQYVGTATVTSQTTPAVVNTITCSIPANIGRNLAGGTSYVYDVQIASGSIVYTLLTGTITPTDDITGA